MNENRSVPRLLAIAVAALAAVFLVAIAAGRLLDPGAPGGEGETHESAGPHGETAAHGTPAAADAVRGLGVSEDGLRLAVLDPERERGSVQPLRFRVLGEDGKPLTEFDRTHTKRMHVIVVRRDLTGFQHLHPQMAADGTWAVPLRLDAAGSYRVFADFAHDGETTTLAGDLRIDGAADFVGLPEPAAVAVSDGGYRVRREGRGAHAGEPARVRFEATQDGHPAALQPYLGAAWHLVALREGDLAFLHVHPEEDGLGFAATFPTPGRYRLFLQFQVDGEVQTVAFTEEVE